MSLIISALEKLDNAVGKLDSSVTSVENILQDYSSRQVSNSDNNVIDVDFVSKRLDKAIEAVEGLLNDEGA